MLGGVVLDLLWLGLYLICMLLWTQKPPGVLIDCNFVLLQEYGNLHYTLLKHNIHAHNEGLELGNWQPSLEEGASVQIEL